MERTTHRNLTPVLFAALCWLLLAAAGGGWAQADANRATGLKPPTPDELAWRARHMTHTEQVALNELGLRRLNRERARRGLQELRVRTAAMGREINPMRRGETAELPAAVDNSSSKFFPPIRDQGQQGACLAFASTYYQFTYSVARAKDLDVRDNSDNAHKYSPKWTYNMINGGENNGSCFSDAYTLLSKHGAAAWADFPYDFAASKDDVKAEYYLQWCLNTNAWRSALANRVSESGYIDNYATPDGLQAIKTMLADGYILVIGTYISSWQVMKIKDDPDDDSDNGEAGKSACAWVNGDKGGHAMTIVGYNDAVWVDVNNNNAVDPGEKGALRIANSWGADWGDHGFTWFAYDALREKPAVADAPTTDRKPGLLCEPIWMKVETDRKPTLLAEFTLNTAARGQIAVVLGASDASSNEPQTTRSPGAIVYQGGDYAFDGTATACDGTFVFDCSDFAKEQMPARLYLTIQKKKDDSPILIKQFKTLALGSTLASTAPKQIAGNAQRLTLALRPVGTSKLVRRNVKEGIGDRD